MCPAAIRRAPDKLRKTLRDSENVPRELREECFAIAAKVLRGKRSPHTVRAYQQSLWFWCEWHAARFEKPLPWPVPISVVKTFLRDFLSHTLPGEVGTPWGTTLPPRVDELLV